MPSSRASLHALLNRLTRLAPLALLAGTLGCRELAPQPELCAELRRTGPPPARRDDVVDVIHGTRVPDPYRWLEADDDPEVVAWADAQDAHARATLSARPEREALREALRAKLDVPSLGVPVARGGRLFYARRAAGADLAVWYVRQGEAGRERVLLDPLALDPHGRASIRQLVPSPDGHRVAYLVGHDGEDEATLRIRDVDTGRDLAERIDGAKYASPSWSADGRSFLYTALPSDPAIPAPERSRHATVRRHVVGTPVEHDQVVYGPLGDAATFVHAAVVDRGRTWVLSLSRGFSATDLYVRDAEGEGPWRPLLTGQAALASVDVVDGRFFVLTNAGAPRYRVVEIDPRQPDPAHWREVIPERPDTLEAADVAGGLLLLRYLWRASSGLELRTLDGRLVAEIPLDGPASVDDTSTDPEQDAAWLRVSALHRAPVVARLSLPAARLEPWEAIDVPVDPGLRLRQVEVASRDGTPVSMFLLHRDDLRRDGDRPTLLTGYGGFGVSLRPAFSPVAALWAERGGVWAVPNLRGGGEYGEPWHEAGRRAHKQNTFDDFIAAAEYLQREGYTRPERLAIRGGSNGGLLVGAVATQRPELFGAVVCAVPLLDMIRYHRFGSGPTWIDEYGSPEVPEQFGWLWGYSPLHRVRPGPAYPPLLMLSADHDDRVHPMHARKFVAALQHAGATPALLRVERGGGHGGSPRLRDRIEAEL
ncbi:MAG: S9 family peptidase, partial [Myxococcales bacterium]|nr:S9 family peptidase [Myxococcales bacterium]